MKFSILLIFIFLLNFGITNVYCQSQQQFDLRPEKHFWQLRNNATITVPLIRLGELAKNFLDEVESTKGNQHLANHLLKRLAPMFPMQRFLLIIGISDQDDLWTSRNGDWFEYKGLFVMIYFTFAVDYYQGNISCYGDLHQKFTSCSPNLDNVMVHVMQSCHANEDESLRQIGLKTIFEDFQEIAVASNMPAFAYRHQVFQCAHVASKKWHLINTLFQPYQEALRRMEKGEKSAVQKCLLLGDVDDYGIHVPDSVFIGALIVFPVILIALLITCLCLFLTCRLRNIRGEIGFFARVQLILRYGKMPESELDCTLFDIEKRIYSGPNSRVYMAKYRFSVDSYRDVAVKMPSKEAFQLSAIQQEMAINARLRHPRIVEYIGFYRDAFGDMRIVNEFMPGGDLHSHLTNDKQIKTVGLIFKFITQIAEGMSYLISKKIIHRDLAARNCMLNRECTELKIADFGLSRQFNTGDNYSASSPMRLPVRWTAIECLGEDGEVLPKSQFSEKSDVWAFGVLVWECFSSGALPYGAQEFSEVLPKLRGNSEHAPQRLECPEHCPVLLYEQLLLHCWDSNPENRPTFAHIMKQIDEIFSKLIFKNPDIIVQKL